MFPQQGRTMAHAESFRTKAEAVSAALSEAKAALLSRVVVCLTLVGGRGRINVTEIRGSKKTVKRYRWTSGEVA